MTLRPIPGERTESREPRFPLVPFDALVPTAEAAYLVKGLIPRTGLIVVWGPPKCGKSFWTFDVVLHAALGWHYRGRRVQQGAIVYAALEGAAGFRNRAEAFRQRFLTETAVPVPLYLMPAPLTLVTDHAELIASIRVHLGDTHPAAVVIDTLNRSLNGSESKDEDMSAFVRAADALRDAFDCAVIIVHHCGVDGTRPRGHTSLTGAADCQIAVKRDAADNINATVEWMKDGPEGATIASRLEAVEVGTDEDGDPVASCVVVEAYMPGAGGHEPRLTKNQATMFTILKAAGAAGLTVDEWNNRAREAGIGMSRKADLYDIRTQLAGKGLVCQGTNGWFAK